MIVSCSAPSTMTNSS